MAIQLAAGNYWKIKSIRIDPISFDVSVLVSVYADVTAFTNSPTTPVGIKVLSFPHGTFTNAAINSVYNTVEAKLILQPEFSGGVIV